MKYCSFCGTEIADKTRVCPKCKRTISQADADTFPEIRGRKSRAAESENADVEAERQKAAEAAQAPEDPAEELHKALEKQRQRVEKNKGIAAAAYLGVLFFMPLVRFKGKDANYGRYHANQGLLILLMQILTFVLNHFIGETDWGRVLCAGLFGGLLYLMIIGIVRAIRGKMQPLPIFGGITIIPPKKAQ